MADSEVKDPFISVIELLKEIVLILMSETGPLCILLKAVLKALLPLGTFPLPIMLSL